ncbi:unnamed protein product [Closterium sp. NIES-53]
MDVWGPARISGQGHERYFLLVVDDYTRYTTVFPLRSKGEVPAVLIPWIRAVRLQLRERFSQDLLVLRLHFDRGGEFSSDLLREFCRGEGILQSFTLPDSPQQNGIAERRIGIVMELNLWPRVSLPETSPTLRWTGEVGNASVFQVWGSRAFVRDTSADKFSACAIPCVFLGFPPDTPGWKFYHPTSRRVFPSQDVTFDESVPFYCLFPYHSTPPPPPPLFLAPSPPPVDPLPPQGPSHSGVSQVDPLVGTVPVEVAVDSGAARGVASGGAKPRGAEPGGAESEGAGSGGAEPAGVEPGGAEPAGAESGGADPLGTASSGGPAAAGAGDSTAGDTGAGGVGVTPGVGRNGAGDPSEPGAAGAGGAGAGGNGASGAGAGGAGVVSAGAGGTGSGGARAGGAGAVDPGVGGAGAGGAVSGGTSAGGTVRPRPYFVPLLQKSKPPLQPASTLPAPYPYTEQTGSLTECREPASCPASPVHTGRRIPRLRPPLGFGTHAMALRPSSVPLRVPLPPPPESSLPAIPDPESDLARAASPTVSRLIATVVTDPSLESAVASSLVVELVDFAVACRLDYATSLIAESVSPPFVGGECALGTDVLEDRQEDFECLAAALPRFASMLLAPKGDPDAPDILTPRSYVEAITGPYSSQWQTSMDAKMASWKSTGTYVDAVPPSRANIVDGMWIFRVKWPPGSPPAFKARYVARGFSQRQGVDYFQTFSPTPKMTTLRVLLHVAAHRDYELHSLDFSTAFLQGNLHEEIWPRCPPGFTESFSAGTQWSLLRPVYGLRQAPREWHDTLRTTLAAPGFTPSTADPSLFLCTHTLLPPFYALVYVLQRFGFQFSSPQPTPLFTGHSLSAPPSADSSCEAEIYVGAMAAQELRWLTFLLADLGEQPHSFPVLYRGQLRLAYVATRANTADIFTKALPPGDHQCFSTVLGLLALLFLTAIDPYWATRGTNWGGPPLPVQYAPGTPEDLQVLEEEEVTYEFFRKAAELPEPTEEAPPPEQGPQLISVTGGEYLYHRVPMEGLPTSEWPEAASFPQPLITSDAVHSGDMDDIAKFPKEVLEYLSVRAFAADADAAADKGPKKMQKDEAERTNIIIRLSDIVRNHKHGINESGTPHTPRPRTPSGPVFSMTTHFFFLEEDLSQQNQLIHHAPCARLHHSPASHFPTYLLATNATSHSIKSTATS